MNSTKEQLKAIRFTFCTVERDAMLPLKKKGFKKTGLHLLSSEPSIHLSEESPPFNYKLAEVVNHHSKCCALQSCYEKSSGLCRGRTPFTYSTINIHLQPLHTTAFVCLMWLDKGHNKTYRKLDAQLLACLRTTVIR